MKDFLIVTALTTALFTLPVAAQQILTLKDFLAKVEKDNPEILAGKKMVESKEAMRKAAGAWEDPMGMFEMERMPTMYLAPGSSSILVDDRLYPKNFGISQKLPFFGTLRQKKKIAGQEKQEAEFGFRAARLEKLSEAKKTYYEWARLQKDRRLLEEAYLTWEKMVNLAQTRYAQAQGGHNEYLRAQVELVKVESEKLENTEAVRKVSTWMVYLAGESLPVESLWAEQLPEKPEEKLPTDSSLALTVGNNPEIKMLAASEQKARFEKNLAAKGYFPDFEVGFQRKQQINHARPSELMNVTGARISFRLPFFFWTSRSREVQGKSLEMEQVSLLRKNMENEKRAEVAMLLAEIERLSGQVRLYKDELLPRARLLVEESQTAYTVGRLSFPDFSEAQLERIGLERKYVSFLSDYWKAKAELEKTVGID